MDHKPLITLWACVCLFGYIHGKKVEVSPACLGCICDAASGCNTTLGCTNDVCGPFRITLSYWTDGGKPSLNNETNPDDSAFEECVNDAMCAARAIQGYMERYSQDCNNDGVVNCDDFARIHKLGGFGCTAPLDEEYEKDFNVCRNVFKE
ncbi:hypothetical protein QAD02_020093 [Eretmocerus hayati]|uniref:Uncharacterized protein n=1 Tax=Eretmocerus hayati TaxID=131215 RepID=A0ACC2PMP7_9HYME|nr:hypothetical protein QAD02_020093 [Eretmocerus hayati]